MSKWISLGAIVFIIAIIGGAYWQGYNHAKQMAEAERLRANAEQETERRETNAAVNRLDDTGLRDTILGVPKREGR